MLTFIGTTITVGILSKERFKTQKPKLIVFFERIEAKWCLMFENIGCVPVKLTSLNFDKG